MDPRRIAGCPTTGRVSDASVLRECVTELLPVVRRAHRGHGFSDETASTGGTPPVILATDYGDAFAGTDVLGASVDQGNVTARGIAPASFTVCG